MPVTQPPWTGSGVDHGDIQDMLHVDIADGEVLDAVRAVNSILRVRRSIGCREVIDGAAVIFALGVGVVRENSQLFIELTMNAYLQAVVVGGSNVIVRLELFEVWKW